MYIYSLKDEKVGRFYPPYYADSDQHAVLEIKKNLCSPEGLLLLRLKDQISLYRLGSIDFNTGYIVPTNAWDVYLQTKIVPNDIADYLTFEEIQDILLSRSAVVFVDSLSNIVSTIPQRNLSPEVTHNDLKNVFEEIKELSLRLSQLGEAYNSHKHTKKGAFLIDDQKKF